MKHIDFNSTTLPFSSLQTNDPHAVNIGDVPIIKSHKQLQLGQQIMFKNGAERRAFLKRRDKQGWQPMQRVLGDPGQAGWCGGAKQVDEAWANNFYTVDVIHHKHEDSSLWVTQLVISPIDAASAIHDWRHLQRVKNEVLGNDQEAFEVYPPESNLMDRSNCFHLWAYPDGRRLSQPLADVPRSVEPSSPVQR
jgi:hypothetical protein